MIVKISCSSYKNDSCAWKEKILPVASSHKIPVNTREMKEQYS